MLRNNKYKNNISYANIIINDEYNCYIYNLVLTS